MSVLKNDTFLKTTQNFWSLIFNAYIVFYYKLILYLKCIIFRECYK